MNYNQQMTTMGCMVDHIHLDKNTFSILFQKGTIGHTPRVLMQGRKKTDSY
jgi:hypothetical protein